MTDKTKRLSDLKNRIVGGREDLHPTDHAEICRELEIFCGKEATRQESTNDKQGVPER